MQDVFRDHILPGALNDPNYLRDNHLAIYDRDGKFIVPDKVTIARIAENPDHYFARHASGCDWALGNLVFHLSNPFNIDLHDMPKQDFFDQEERAFSSGCIWVDHAEKLAGMLLKNDGRKNELKTLHRAVNSYKRKTFILTKQVPVQITYLTCEVNEGRLIVYKDIYNLDKSLETALYNVNQSVVMR
jgi:murein L,D-transpeptidase YcbB/YkuD